MAAKSKRSKKKKSRKQVIVASRTSNRVPRDGIPIATKAANRAKNRNITTGTVSNGNPFTVLNSTATANLKKVVLDLDLDIGDVEEQIDIFRVEELARAAIAEANYQAFLDKQKERQEPLTDSLLKDLAMVAVDNQERGVNSDPAKGGLGRMDQDAHVDSSNLDIPNEIHVLEC